MLDLDKTGYDMFFKPYQRVALELLWANQDGLNTKQIWELTNNEIFTGISRASIINFLAEAADNGILTYREEKGEVGYRRSYWQKYDKCGLNRFLTEKVSRVLDTLNSHK